jgi:hypothetical protein
MTKPVDSDGFDARRRKPAWRGRGPRQAGLSRTLNVLAHLFQRFLVTLLSLVTLAARLSRCFSEVFVAKLKFLMASGFGESRNSPAKPERGPGGPLPFFQKGFTNDAELDSPRQS